MNIPFFPPNTTTSPLLYIAGSWPHQSHNIFINPLCTYPSHPIILVKYAEDSDSASLQSANSNVYHFHLSLTYRIQVHGCQPGDSTYALSSV